MLYGRAVSACFQAAFEEGATGLGWDVPFEGRSAPRTFQAPEVHYRGSIHLTPSCSAPILWVVTLFGTLSKVAHNIQLRLARTHQSNLIALHQFSILAFLNYLKQLTLKYPKTDKKSKQ